MGVGGWVGEVEEGAPWRSPKWAAEVMGSSINKETIGGEQQARGGEMSSIPWAAF